MVGRFIGSAILQKVKTGTVLGIAAFCSCALVLTSMLTTGSVAMWSILLVGFFNSIMFPSIFTLGIAKLGPRTGDGSGLLIMAIVGGAIASGNGYYGPGYYGYGPRYYGPGYGYYGGGPAYVADDYYGGCVWQRQRFWDGYGWRVRRVRVCG